MNREISTKRISGMPTSIFYTISKLANEYKATNLGQGYPDFDGPHWIMDAAYKAMKSGKNQYAPSNGIYTMRKSIQTYYNKYYGLQFDTETEITVTAGATEALFSTIMALVDEGDEVILFEPYYDAHQADVLVAGGIPKYVTLKKPDFTFSEEEFEKAITPKTKMIIINNPHNPTGKVYSQSELEFIAKLAVKHDLIVLSDEVYEFLTYDDVKHIPIATLPGMRERTVTISSTGKTFGMTGWKVGYASASQKLTDAIQKIHQWATFTINTPGQHAMVYAFSQLDEYLPDFKALYQRKRDYALDKLSKSQFKPHVPFGSYFMMVDIPEAKGIDDIECASELIKQQGVATIPPSVFYSNSDEGKTMLRVCFAKTEDTLKAGIEKMAEY